MADDAPFSEAENHLWTDEERPCWHCELPTKWLELAFEAPLHPGECTQAKYAELAEADRQAAEEQERREREIPRGTRKVENGQTLVWTGIAWRLVPKSELEDEQRRRR